MEYPWLIPLIAACASAVLGILVALRGPRASVKRVFVLVAATLISWNLFFIVLYSVSDRELAFRLTRILRNGTFFLVAAIFHLAVSVRPNRGRLLSRCIVADYFLASGFAIANSFDLFVSDLRPFELGFVPVATPLYHVLPLYAVINFVATIILLSRDYFTTEDANVHTQIKFWLLGMVVALPLGLTNLLPVYGLSIYPLGNLGAAIWAGIVAYAILRHRLMDIEVVITKGLAYAGVAAVILIPISALSVSLQRLRFGRADSEFTIWSVTITLACVFLSPILLSGAQRRVGRSLFRSRYARRAALVTFGKSVIRVLERRRLVELLCEGLFDLLGLERIAVFLLESSGGRLELQQSRGGEPRDRDFGLEHSFVRWLGHPGAPRLTEELEGEQGSETGIVGKTLRENAWDLCVPLKSGRQITGFLALGRRRGLRAFSRADADIIGDIAGEASIAFDNARLSEELQRSRDIIDRSDRLSALGTLAAGIAHEIRNPLVSIHTFFQMAPARLDDEEFRTSFLQLVGGEVARIKRLIDDLLTFARTPTQQVAVINMNDVVDRAITLLRPEARQARVDLVEHSDAVLPVVLGDFDQMLQVLINVVLNAIQATGSGGRVSVETRCTVDEGGRCCRIDVSDNGVGIPDQLRESIFNPFFTTKEKGTGLGLAIANRIVTEAGGFIAVDSRQGAGTRFSITLPAARVQASRMNQSDADQDSLVSEGADALPHRA